MLKKTGFFVFILLMALGVGGGQNDPRGMDIRFTHLTLEDGLSQGSVSCMLHDQKGFMWFGTQDGLNKYDGYGFDVFRSDPENPAGLSSSIIFCLHEVPSGAIWIGTDGGLDMFNPETGRFTHYRSVPGNPSSLSDNYVTAILSDRSGVLWVGTPKGLNRFHPGTGTFTRYFKKEGDPAGLSHNHVTAIYEDRSGALWIGTAYGFNKFHPGTGTFTRYDNGGDYITAFCEDHLGEFRIGTKNGLKRFNRETGESRVYRYNHRDPYSLSSNYVTAVYEDGSGVLWVGTFNRGLNTFDRGSERFFHYRSDADDPFSLGSARITSIYEDRSGVLWIGVYAAGVDRFDRNMHKFPRYGVNPGNPGKGLSHNLVFALLEDRSGMVWIGTLGGGLNKFDRREKRFTHYRAEPGNPKGLSSDMIAAVYEDKSGILWIGTADNGLCKFNRETGIFKTYSHRPGDSAGLIHNLVQVIHEDEDGNLRLGTGGGLCLFNPETERFTTYRHIPGDPNSLSGNSVGAISEGGPGVLWIGTSSGGLNKFDLKTRRFRAYRKTAGGAAGLSSDYVQSIYRDPRGVLWLGTHGGGLNKFDPQKEVFTHYREKDGLANDVVYGILPDDHGFLWMATNKGLSRFDPRGETFKNFTPEDGLQSNEFNGGASYRSLGGELFFGGVNGFNAFYPGEIKDNPFVPPVVITGFRLFYKPVGIGGDSPLKKHITHTREIKLAYKQNVFSFNFAALDYTSPGKNRYRYMMEGFDREWISTDASRRFAGYTNLDPGDYIFRVQGSNNDGVWNEVGTFIKIIITPPYWQTWWFRVLSAFLVVLLGVLFYRGRMKRISRKTRLETELLAARSAQLSIMPQSDPHIEGICISGICVPAHEVGGDFFDYMWLDPDKSKFGIVVGDVSGKAMEAAMTAVMSSGMIYSKVDSVTSVKEIMTQVNRPLFRKTDKKMFTALCLVSLDTRTGEFVFSNAGLNEPLLKTRGSGIDSTVYIQSVGLRLPLGSFKNSIYQETTLKLKPRDVMVLFTDGIPDALNMAGEFYGLETLKRLVAEMDTAALSAAEIKERIIADVKRFSGTVPQHDDMTVVVIKYR